MKAHDGQCLNLVSYLALATRVHMNSPGRDASPSQVPSQQCWYSSTAEYTEANEINSLVLVSLTRLNSQTETLHKIHLSSIISLFISYHHNVIPHQFHTGGFFTGRHHDFKAHIYAISSDTPQLQFIKLHHIKQERF